MDEKLKEARHAVSDALSQPGIACVTCSFQAEDMAVLHLVREHRPDIPVLFLETGYHFKEVYEYRDEMTARYGLKLVNVMPLETVAQQEEKFGKLYQSQPDQCCKLRKVGPLFRSLEDYDIWFTGLRRVQSPTRANLQIHDEFPLPSGKRSEQSFAARIMDRQRRVDVLPRAGYSVTVALRSGIYEHRLPALHAIADRPRECAFGTLGGAQN